MQHTNSQRQPDGRFGASDGPKAKRIEVWLHPQTVELLDTLTKQWKVGRGKVIDQLLTRGPVPPQSWTTVTESPPPTHSAPPEPQPAAVEPEPEPEPTAGGRESFAEAMERMEAEHAGEWEISKADAKVIGCQPKRVRQFKREHNLSHDRPLSVDAQLLLKQELEAEQLSAKGHELAVGARLEKIGNRLELQPRLAQTICDQCETVETDRDAATDYLLRLLPDIGVKPYKRLCKGLWDALPQLLPEQDYLHSLALHLSEIPARRALFWGVILRLDQLKGNPPTTGGPFAEWCQLKTYADHHDRKAAGDWNDIDGVLLGQKWTTSAARIELGLPDHGTDLTAKAINDAFKALARTHHPDAGGDASKFQRISEAKDRLLLEVAA